MLAAKKWLGGSSLSWQGLRWGAAVISIAAHGAAASLAWMTIETTPPKTIEAFTVELISADRLKGAMSVKPSVSAPVPVDQAEQKRETDAAAGTVSAAVSSEQDSSREMSDSEPVGVPAIEIEIARAVPATTPEETQGDPVPEAAEPIVSLPPPPVKPPAPNQQEKNQSARNRAAPREMIEEEAHLAMPRAVESQGGSGGGAAPSKGETAPMTAASYSVGTLGNKPPAYPERARRNAFEGRVLLRVTVSETGAGKTVTILKSSGYTVLDEAARAAVIHWRFVPAQRAGVAVAASLDVPIVFRLTENKSQ